MNTPKIKYSLFLLSTLVFFTIHCSKSVETDPKPTIPRDESIVILTDEQLKNAPIETTKLSMEQIATVLKLNGKIDVPPQNLVSVSTPLGGYLKNTKLLPGMKVSKGQIIAVIENPQFVQLQQDFLLAKSKYHFAQLDFNRQQKLNLTQASSEKTLQLAQAEMNTQQILMNSIAKQLLLININPANVSSSNIQQSIPVFSSINGFVSKVNANIGKYLTPSEVFFELINPTDIHLNLKVFEKDLEMLKTGQRIVAYTNTNPDKKYIGEVLLTSKNMNSQGIAEVHCHFKNYDHALIPGMYMNAEVETATSFTNAIPEESIVDFEGKSFVFVQIKKQTYKMLPVSLGETENGFVQIINSQDLVSKNIVTKNAYTLLMKLKNTAEE